MTYLLQKKGSWSPTNYFLKMNRNQDGKNNKVTNSFFSSQMANIMVKNLTKRLLNILVYGIRILFLMKKKKRRVRRRMH